MSFAAQAAKEASGIWWGIEVSFDDFSTISYRWATHSGNVGGQEYDRRILHPMQDLTRGFGTDNLPVASQINFDIDNTDFGVDWLGDRSQFNTQVVRARFRVSVGLWDTTTATSVQTQQIGLFVALDYPTQYAERITLTLTDDQLGQLNDLLTPPTTNDWIAGTSASDNPFAGAASVVPGVDFNQPWPLAFGAGWVTGYRLTNGYNPVGSSYPSNNFGLTFPGTWGILVCATADLSDVNSVDVKTLVGNFAAGLSYNVQWAGQKLKIPATWTDSGGNLVTIWKAVKTPTFAVGAYNWRLLWISFDPVAYSDWFQAVIGPPGQQNANVAPGPTTPAVGPDAWSADGWFDAFDTFDVLSFGALSSVTSFDIQQNPVDVIQDLVQYYSNMRGMAGGPIDTARFNRARAARSSYFIKGVVSVPFASAISSQSVVAIDPTIGGKLAYQDGVLRAALASICGSSDIDIFLNYAGQAAVTAQVADFASATTVYPTLDEARVNVDSYSSRVPSNDERWAPYNSVFITNPPTGNELGPFTNVTALAAWGGVPKVRHLEGMWWPYLQTLIGSLTQSFNAIQSTVWSARNLESVARSVVTFDTDFTFFATGLDLGDDFLFTFTRGGQSPLWSGSLFRLDQLVVHPDLGTVTVTAVWMDDLKTTAGYLLDDETLLTRVASSGGRTASVTDSSSTVTFSSGSLISDGVAAGDELILKDATEDAATFTRSRALKIASVTDATHLVVTDPSLLFGGGTHAVATWEIRRSHATYPTSSSDPTHYPSGGAMYGKVSDNAGLYGDGSAANQLLQG